MATLTINGRKVTVDDSFLSLNPEQQQTTVNEIAASLGISGPNGDRSVPEFDPGIDGYNPKTGMVEHDPGALTTGILGAVEGIPIVGPSLLNAAEYGSSLIGSALTGEDRDKVQSQMGSMRETGNEKHPNARLAGNVAGAIGVTAPLGATALGARAFGITGNGLLSQSLASGATNLALNAADTAARGGDVGDVGVSSAIGGGLGLLMPGASQAVSAGFRVAGPRIGSTLRSMTNQADEASMRVGQAMGVDRSNSAVPLLGPADEAAARLNNQPLLNVDRGGETTRALGRAASNLDPDARAVINRTVEDRFATQGARVESLLNRLTGGAMDDLALQEAMKSSARAANKPAYDRAFQSPHAQAMWNADLAGLMQAPAMQAAAKGATSRGANRAVVEGFNPVRNPFREVDGKLTLGRNKDGSVALPSLQFWDQVKRNLDSMIGTARRSGDNTSAADLTALKSKFVSTLDDAVPEYHAARAGAAAAFGAEDALSAGRTFASTTRNTLEMRRAVALMSKPEKQAFQTGYASELLDKVKASNDRVNVIRNIFGSEESREKLVLTFGANKAREIEAFVRIENAMDLLRGAMGNSTTARQLLEMGAVGGGTFALTGGDWNKAMAASLAAGGARWGQRKINEGVMKHIANILVSGDEKLIHRAIQNAALSKAHMDAIEAMTKYLVTVGGASGALTVQ